MIEKLNKILLYLSEGKQNEVAKRVEFNRVNNYKNKLEWEGLSSYEKQEKRKSNLKSIKKYKEEDNVATFEYENAIISFYDLCMEVLEELKSFSENTLSARIEILIKIDMESIDSDVRLQDKVLSPVFVYESIFRDLSDVGIFFPQSGKMLIDLKIIEKKSRFTT